MVGIRIASSWIRRSMLAITLMARKIFIRRIRSVEMMPILHLTMQNRHALKLVPNTNGKSVHFTVTWLDANGTQVGTVFDRVIDLEGTYQWDNFCRFASLVTPERTATMTDSTYVVNGGFATLKIGSANWGITTSQVPLAWIMNEPKCKLNSKWAVGESFTIDHWA